MTGYLLGIPFKVEPANFESNSGNKRFVGKSFREVNKILAVYLSSLVIKMSAVVPPIGNSTKAVK